jgi:integrase
MQRKNLTEEGVAKLKAPPKGKQFENYYDGLVPGLVLRVSSKGRKTWAAQYYTKATGKDGKPSTIATTKALGLYPILKVKEARDKARQFLADPHKALREADNGSFKEVAEKFIKRHVEEKKLRTEGEIKRVLAKYVYPKWQNKPFRDIKRSEVTDLIDQIQDKHGARMADVVLAILRKLMHWYESRDDDYRSPVPRGVRRYDARLCSRKRILEDEEIRALWTACDTTTDKTVFGAMVKVLLLTAQRREKVSTMQWDDIANGIWTIPTEAREKANAGSLTLPQVVQDVVEAQPRLEDNPYVFAGRGGAALNSFSQCKAALDKLLPGMEPWTLHDLRRTAKSLMARAGVLPHISERVLGHAIAGVEGVYDRHSYDSEKADALQRLADLVDRIVNPPEDNVVPIRR